MQKVVPSEPWGAGDGAVSPDVRTHPRPLRISDGADLGAETAGGLPGVTVLVVEDNHLQQLVIAQIVKEVGYAPILSSDAAAVCRRLCDGWRPDLVVTDLHLPRVGGAELVATLRRDPHLDRVPVILCSSVSEAEGRAVARRVGADAFVGKWELVERLPTTLRVVRRSSRCQRRRLN